VALRTRLGVYEADRILFVSDGAPAIRWIRERAFPEAIELLDWYHLVEALRTAIGTERPDRLQIALAAAEPGDAERLCELLAGWAYEEAATNPDRASKLAAVHGYVASNRRAIENYAIVPLASSGPMEKAVDIVIARRFKARGMSWFRRGVPRRSTGSPDSLGFARHSTTFPSANPRELAPRSSRGWPRPGSYESGHQEIHLFERGIPHPQAANRARGRQVTRGRQEPRRLRRGPRAIRRARPGDTTGGLGHGHPGNRRPQPPARHLLD